MKFVMQRDRTHVSLRGHSVEFKKGVPTHVPPALHAEVIEAGAVPEDESVDIEELRDPTKPAAPQAPADPLERNKAITEAMEVLATRNAREDFTANSLPHVKALEAALGWKVHNKERDELWAKFIQGADA